MSVYTHACSPFWQFDFQLRGHRFCGSTGIRSGEPRESALEFEAQQRRQALAKLASEGGLLGRRPRKGQFFIYFIRADNAVKIGIARDPKDRLATLQTAQPGRLHLMAVMPGGRRKEQALHRKFRHRAVDGEWFTYFGEVADYIEDVRRLYGEVP